MSDEAVPVGKYEGDWWEWTQTERDYFMDDEYRSITEFDHARRHYHNQEGFFAEPAGGTKCLALGHVEPDGGWIDDTDHPNSWEGEPLCRATTYDTCCTDCEGECEYEAPRDLLWTAVAKLAVRA